MNEDRKPNNLINEKSPYLLQHAYNPINWFSWSKEAFEKAKEEDKPIFLSIGYSTCHWCHVMERESFEDSEVAEIMNKYFVAIKVDREERPDIDSVYMTVSQGLTGSGGWPLTIVMTPDQKPFYAGTYFPKKSRNNMPGIIDILETIAYKWDKEREKIISSSENILSKLQGHFETGIIDTALKAEILDRGYMQLREYFDKEYGGFGPPPKFPTPHKLMFLLRYYKETGEDNARKMVEKSLDSMYRGGMFDHIGFGFFRYSTDEKWLLPHFEKMLYDNALLIITYLEAYEVTKKDLYKEVARKSLEYVFRKLKNPEGGFYSAEDADSEGEEGKFYLLEPSEIYNLLGAEDGEYFCDYFDITHRGNFEGKSIPNLIKNRDFSLEDERIVELSKQVLEYREKGIKLNKDDKILTSWNGLMLAALGKAYRVFGEEKYLEEGEKTINLIFNSLIDEDGRLLVRLRDGEAMHKGYLDDYAFLIFGLIELYQSSFNVDYLEKAVNLNSKLIELFWDRRDGGFFFYGEDGEKLIARPKEIYDGAIPSGNSVVAYNLIRLAKIIGDSELEEMAEKQLNFISSNLDDGEINYTFYLVAASFALGKSKELVCVINNNDDLEDIKNFLREELEFNLTVIVKNDENRKDIERLAKFTREYKINEDKSSYYLCKGKSCLQPMKSINELKKYI